MACVQRRVMVGSQLVTNLVSNECFRNFDEHARRGLGEHSQFHSETEICSLIPSYPLLHDLTPEGTHIHTWQILKAL